MWPNQQPDPASTPWNPLPPTPSFPVALPAYFTADELNTHVFDEVVAAITDGDTTLMPQAIAAAQYEAVGYMSRFDFMTIFSETGTNRDPVFLLYLKDMAVWHFIPLANPNIDYEVRKDRYNKAIRWFEKLEAGRIVPLNWPMATQSDMTTEFHVMSTQWKRQNNY